MEPIWYIYLWEVIRVHGKVYHFFNSIHDVDLKIAEKLIHNKEEEEDKRNK